MAYCYYACATINTTMTDEWTFVSSRNKKRSSKPSRQRRHHGGVDGHNATTNTNDDGMKRFFDNRINNNHPKSQQTEAEKTKDRERIRDAVLESISARPVPKCVWRGYSLIEITPHTT
ncbi:hypothetical protein QTG54_006547 [Skeletonema marinoi]|uniref:Uncharacterized protein n=1 Tax=Skeletonema marinoi TaxID=267567 RepID=A0AAD9DEM3_9STRA|nr:hypothetical protein QTG54_006547 [Skeletonema marinoi]